jgi:hypothetical protein
VDDVPVLPPVDASAPPGAWPAGSASAEEAAPRWGSLASSSAAPSRSQARPDPVRGTAPVGDLDDDYDDEDDEDDDERPSHPYTWLQLIVLALVAFVLGFLIVLLGSEKSDDATGPTPTPVTASAVAGELTTT